MNKVLLFINPTSRQGAKCADRVIAWLKENQLIVLNPNYDPAVDNMLDVIERFRDQVMAVIVGGGDGSANHALPSLLKTKVPLLLIPLGTANNLARTLSLPSDPIEALTLLKTGRIESIDVGYVQTATMTAAQSGAANTVPTETISGIPFLNVVGIGVSARVNRTVPHHHKRWFGVFAFAWAALRVITRMTPFRVSIECDQWKHVGRTWQVTVCNGRNYGSGLTIHETASLFDASLHGLSTEIGRWWHGFGLIPFFRAGKFGRVREVVTFSGRKVMIHTRHPKHVDIDGDIKARTPVEISVLPKALRIYTPVPLSHES